MLPIRDHNPSRGTPVVTWALIAVNIGVFLSYWPLFDDPRALHRFYSEWGMIPALVTGDGELQGLVTSMFLHGGWMHLAGNMLFLWIFGDNLEEEMGHVRYLLFYLATGILAGLAHVMAGPTSPVPTVGASGAIAGVMGGYLLLFPKARVDILIFIVFLIRIVPVPAWLMLGLWFALQILGGFASNASAGGVAYWAHAGGFVVGMILTLPLFLRRGAGQFWAQSQGRPPRPEAQYNFSPTRIPKVRRRR